jgi:Zn-dependent protease
MPRNGFRLFEIFGITVYLHWSWLLVALIEMDLRRREYGSLGWNVAEYLVLFAIVLMHEFGHALACRSVGGKADRIVLWPLGGVAYVSPPMRPGAMLWSIVAGPLVNVALLPVTIPFFFLSANSDLDVFLRTIAGINLVLLIFNMLPIYPLDGGKILWSVLWFMIGCGRALMAASVVGIVGAAGLALVAMKMGNTWLLILAAFAAYQAWVGFNSARMMRRRETLPRRAGMACPVCRTPPPVGPFWFCGQCRNRFDAFEHPMNCPACGMANRNIACMFCGARAPFGQWAQVTVPRTIPRNFGVDGGVA